MQTTQQNASRDTEQHSAELRTDEARQGERQGMIFILLISTLAAAVLLGLIFAIFGS